MSDDLNQDRSFKSPQLNDERKKNNNSFKIVGFNLLGLIIYTVLCKQANSIGSLMFEALLVGIHMLVCLAVSAIQKKTVWLLSAFMVLAIGFSTCVYAGDFRL